MSRDEEIAAQQHGGATTTRVSTPVEGDDTDETIEHAPNVQVTKSTDGDRTDMQATTPAEGNGINETIEHAPNVQVTKSGESN